jgi:hypothetical protein
MRTSRRARDLDLALNRARGLANDLANDLARVHNPAGAHDSARNLARALDVAFDSVRNRGYDRGLADDLDFVLGRARGLADDLAHYRGLADGLADGLAIDLVGLAIDLVGDLALARALAGAGAPAGRVAPLAGRLLAAAARLLPAGDRARYAEEFRSELAELAAAGAGRRRQLAHAARVARSAPQLRAGLRAPRRRKAAP